METNYKLLKQQVDSLFSEETSVYSNIANFTALLNEALDNINWVGFYLWSNQENCLLLNSFQGKPACVRIPEDKGVCGAGYRTKQTQLVPDVEKFPGHIACDSASKSEIVIPIIINDKCYGVLDIDAPVLNRFSKDDQDNLEEVLDKFIKLVDISDVQK